MTSQVVTHIVLFKYRSDISWSDLEAHFTSFKALQQRCVRPGTGKPYMLSMRMGRNNSWEPFSKGMTHGFVLEFASAEDLDYYLLDDPVHLEFSRQAKPLIEDSLVLDINDGELFSSTRGVPGRVSRGRYRGACHCGEVEWIVKVEDEGLKHVLCHCDTCKKLGGGPYSCNAIVPVGALQITRGKAKSYAYKGASGKSVHCYFCPTCTSHIYHHQDIMLEKIIVRTLLLDGGNDFQTGGEIFAEGKLKWVQELRQHLVNGS